MYNPAVMYEPDLKIYDYEPEGDFLLGLKKGPIDILVSVLQIDKYKLHVKPCVLNITCDPRTETVGSLKNMLEDLTHLPANKQKLNGKVGYMTSNSLTLAAYNVGNGDQLFLGYSENGDGNCKGGGAGGGGSFLTPVPGEVRGGPFCLMTMFGSYEFPKKESLDEGQIDMLSDKKEQNLDEEEKDYDGWQDEWDKVFDLRANSVEYMKSMKEYHDSMGSPLLLLRHQTMCETRGYDPITLGVGREDRYMEDLDLDQGECIITVTEVAAHAVNLYNHRKSKNLEFVRVTKASKVWDLGDEIQRFFFVTFLARQKGNPYTLKYYQTRAQTTYRYAIVDIMSFRPKPI